MHQGTAALSRAIDDGEPLQLLEPPEGAGMVGFAVSTAVCANPACSCSEMQLTIRPIRAAPDGTGCLQGPRLSGEFSTDTRHLVLDRPGTPPFTDEIVDWISNRLADPLHQGWLVERWRRMRSQIGDPAYPSGTPPEQTEFLVPYCEVFPWDFDLTVAHSGRKYLATDTYCMNPSCRCDDVAVQFFDVTQQAGGHKPRLGHVKASVRRLRDPVINGQPILQQLWNALLEQVGVARLRDRFGRMRQVAARQPAHAPQTPARNAPCPCGSGRKYKRCCGK